MKEVSGKTGLSSGLTNFVIISSCIRGQIHCCCCVSSVAIPCSEEVPIAITVAGLTIFPFRRVGCMQTVGDIKGMNMER